MKATKIILLALFAFGFLFGCDEQNRAYTVQSPATEGVYTIEQLNLTDYIKNVKPGELVVISSRDQCAKYFPVEIVDTLAIDFDKKSVIIIQDRSAIGIHTIAQQLYYYKSTGYVLSTDITQSYEDLDTIWTKVILTPKLPEGITIDSQIKYVTFDSTLLDVELQIQSIDLQDQTSNIDPDKLYIVRSQSELALYLPKQTPAIDFSKYSLLLVRGDSESGIQRVDPLFSFIKKDGFTLKLNIYHNTILGECQWVKLIQVPVMPLGVSIGLDIEFNGQISDGVVEISELELGVKADDLTRIKYGDLRIIRSQDDLSRNLSPEISDLYGDIDFECNSILLVKGWCPKNIAKLDHKLINTPKDGLVYQVDVDLDQSGAIDPLWTKMILTPVIPSQTNITFNLNYNNDEDMVAEKVEFTELEQLSSMDPNTSDFYIEFTKRGVKPDKLCIIRSAAEFMKFIPEDIARKHDIDFSKNLVMLILSGTPYPFGALDQKLSFISTFGYIYRITIQMPEDGNIMVPEQWARMILTPRIDQQTRAIVEIDIDGLTGSNMKTL